MNCNPKDLNIKRKRDSDQFLEDNAIFNEEKDHQHKIEELSDFGRDENLSKYFNQNQEKNDRKNDDVSIPINFLL